MLAKAEEEIPLYNIERTIELSDYKWMELGMGIPNIASKSSTLTYKFLNNFQNLGISAVDIQKALFAFILFTSFIGMNLLAREIFRKNINLNFTAFVASIFYVINPFMAINIWGRFLYPFFFLLPTLPFLFYFFIKHSRERKIKYALYFALTMLVFAYTFASPAFLITVFIPIGIYITFQVISSRSLKIVKSAFVIILTTLLSNFWWMISLLSLKASTDGLVDLTSGTRNLVALSKYYSPVYITRLLSLDFFQELPWGEKYRSLLYQAISWLPFVIVLITIWFNRRKNEVKYLTILLLVSIFFAKGSVGLFGDFFIFLFESISPLQLLRNSFEKTGILVVLCYSLLIGFGLGKLPKKIGILFFILTLFYSKPLLTGEVFITHGKSIATEVPSYYKEINSYLEKDIGDYRIIQLPATYSDGSIMKWDNPYHGGEPSHFLYDYHVISRNISNQYYKNIYFKLLKNIPYEDTSSYAGLFSAKYIIVNKDIDYEKLNLFSPEKYQDYLENYYVPSDERKQICESLDKVDNRWICDISGTEKDFREYNFLHTVLENSESASIKVELVDYKNQVFTWEETVANNNLALKLYSPIESSSNLYFENISTIRITSDNSVSVSGIHIDKGNPVKQKNIEFVRQFGNLYLYKLSDEVLTPVIYSPDKVDLSFKKISPDEYRVSIKNAQKPFKIILNNLYHAGWKAYFEGEVVGEHFIENNSVNGYLIDKKGSYELIIKFY